MDAPESSPREDSCDRPNTDSMVTVSLSDVQSNMDVCDPECSSHSVPQTPTGNLPVLNLESNAAQTISGQLRPGLGERDSVANLSLSQYTAGTHQDDERGDTVDWTELEKTEEQEPRGGQSDESTTLLLARLEHENNILATNPKSNLVNTASSYRQRSSRYQSLRTVKRLIEEPSRFSLRYSQLPPPPMTELEFWAALVADYHQTAKRLPTLTANKVRGGIPPPLRGVVWPSLAGARDTSLVLEYERLCSETSPYESLIEKDIGRSFPNVEMFRDAHGEGQQMLARVLKCFSLYDAKIGYCQGLGFVVGPLLMHMTEAEAFCVLVRLMDHYNLRVCYLPDLSGLHLRVYQFQNLLARHLPSLFAHLEALRVEPAYVSQWFLSFFAVTCPLPMLLRIYDVILLEGASETLMRVALSLMQRNEKRILACTEFEDVMQFVLSRCVWDIYACNADDFVSDFVSLTSLVTKENLEALEASYNQSQGALTSTSFPQMQVTASRFLGRLWTGSGTCNSAKSLAPSPNHATQSSRSSIRRSTSKQSMASTFSSIESTSDASTTLTEISADPQKRAKSIASQNRDRDLHSQIEDLLIALSDLQRQQAELSRELQQEREEREEDHEVAKAILEEVGAEHLSMQLAAKAETRFVPSSPKQISIPHTKRQLVDDLNRWKGMHEVEVSRSLNLARRVEEIEQENSSLREQLREARGRIQDGYRERQRLERTVLDLRSTKISTTESPTDTSRTNPGGSSDGCASSGLREFKLMGANSPKSGILQKTTFSKRSSSLGLQTILSTENNGPVTDETLLLELVNAKTAEAIARQELEEVKCKLDSLRKMIGPQLPRAERPDNRKSWLGPPTAVGVSKAATEPAKLAGTAANSGGFFSGWGRRTLPGNETCTET